MSSKTKEQYVEVLSALRDEGAEPTSILTDFEKAEFQAFSEVYPEVTIKACFFHLGQSFFRRIKKLGLVKRFEERPVRQTFRWTISMAFLPPELIRRAMALIIDQAPPRMEGYLYYVAKNYIGLSAWERQQKERAFTPNADTDRMLAGIEAQSTPQRANSSNDLTPVRSLLSGASFNLFRDSLDSTNVTAIIPEPVAERNNSIEVANRFELPIVRSATFSSTLWNVRDRVVDEMPRCQASMEATHLSLQKQSKRRPRMYDFLTTLHKFDTKKVQEAREAILKPGGVVRRREYARMDRTLQHLVKSVNFNSDQSIKVFLESVSLALQHLEADFMNSTEDFEVEAISESANDENVAPMNAPLNEEDFDYAFF